jgi:hypothetical protein
MKGIINYSEVSRLLTSDRTNIRADYSGKKYDAAISELREFEKQWTAKFIKTNSK